MSAQQQPAAVARGKHAILLGATGAVGSSLLSALLASGAYGQIHAFVRKPFKERKGLASDERVVEHIVDFDKLIGDKPDVAESKKFRDIRADVVYIALGTTRAQAGSAAAFEKIDREYVVGAARASLVAPTEGKGQDEAHQRVVYCSSAGASSSSPFLYPKSKGLTEDALSKLGYAQTFIFRPGFLKNANREKPRRTEALFGWFTSNVLSKISDGAEIGVSPLAKAMVWAGTNGVEGLDSKKIGTRIQGEEKKGTAVLIGNAEAAKIAGDAELLQ